MADVVEAKLQIRSTLIKEEGLRLRPYKCAAGVPTIGVGATAYPDGRKVQMSDQAITEQSALEMLDAEMFVYVNEVLKMVNTEATTNQLIGLVVCAYNIGLDGLRSSTMIKAHNRGDYASASRAFTLWNKITVNGKKVENDALTARRLREAAIYATADDSAEVGKLPQAVNEESSVVTKPIGITSVGTILAGVLAQVSDIFGSVSPAIAKASEIATSIGVKPLFLFGVAISVFGVISLFYRFKQRILGWS